MAYALLAAGVMLLMLAGLVGCWTARSRSTAHGDTHDCVMTRVICLLALGLLAVVVLWRVWSVAMFEWTCL